MAVDTLFIDLLTENPWVVIVVAILARAGLAYQRQLSWYEYRTLHGVKRMLFPVLENRFPAGKFVSERGGRDDAEFITTYPEHHSRTAKQLKKNGGALHLISSLKRRPDEHGDTLTVAHIVFTHHDGKQTEAYLFQNDDGSTDVYAHIENSVTDPLAHLTTGQHDGDTRNVVHSALGIEPT